MKKRMLLIVFVLIIAMLLSSCDAASEQKELAEQMLSCLSQCDMAGAAEYLSPEIMASSRTGLLQIANILNRRTVESLTESKFYFGIKFESGYIGIEKRINYLVVLSDGTVGELQTIHYSNRGFVGFHLNLDNAPSNNDTSSI